MDNFANLLPAYTVSIGVFLALWPVSVWMRDVSIVDGWWAPGFLAAALVIWDGTWAGHNALLLGLIGVWALRLAAVMIRRRIRHGAEDKRYQLIRASHGPSFWWKSLFIVFLLQGILQAIIALPLVMPLLAPPTALGLLGILGACIAVAGLLLETVADAQLDAFKQRAPRASVCTTGLRAHVRHPNYTGEMIFWVGLWMIAADAGMWWTIVSPVILIFLLVKVSGAPMQIATMLDDRPGYAEHVANTPAFLPALGKRTQVPAE